MTCRAIIRDALRELDVIAPGDELNVDDLEVGLARLQALVLRLFEGRGPWRTADVTADHTVGEDERVRVGGGAVVDVTLPDAVDDGAGGRRAPRDGARVSIVGTTQGTFLYRADRNAWIRADTLSADDPAPFSAAFHGGLAAILAVELANAWPGRPAPTPLTLKRAAEARVSLMFAAGTPRARTAADYF